jgi:hypothetical protein
VDLPGRLLQRFHDPGRLRENAAFLIAFLSLLFVLGSISDGNATERASRNNVLATNAYAFFQAKNIRQHDYELALDEARFLLDTTELDAASRQRLTDRIAFYESEISRYESEPDPNDPDNPLKGEGKEQLLAQARHFEQEAREARRRGASFDHTSAASQVAIVLASAAILTGIRALLTLSLVGAILSILFYANAMLDVIHIPFPINLW